MNIRSISSEISPILHQGAASKQGISSKPAPKIDGAGQTKATVRFGPADGEEDANGHGVETAHPVVNGQGLSLKFVVDEATGRRVIEVIERDTGQVIRQIPPEEALEFLRQLQDRKGSWLSIKL